MPAEKGVVIPIANGVIMPTENGVVMPTVLLAVGRGGLKPVCFVGARAEMGSSALSRGCSMSSKLGTHRPVKARFWPWLEPFLVRKSLKSFKSFL